MSGAEGLAIIGCVFGLIQAYDAAERTVSRIKARRAARQESQPSVHLEKSLERGKKDIESLVETGRDRFGQTYLLGDDKDVVLVQNALLQITNQTYHGLMERLAEARDDDTIVDYSDCIDAADSSRMRATIVLNEYFLKKQQEAMQTSAAVHSRMNNPAHSPQLVAPPAETQNNVLPEPKLGANSVTKTESPVEVALPRRSSTFAFMKKFTFHSRSASNMSTASTLHESPPLGGDQPVFPERPRGKIAHKVSAQSLSRPSANNGRSHNPSHASSTAGRTSAMSGPSSKSISRRTSFSSTARSTGFKSEVAEITKYGGFCESAHLLREGKQGKALTRKEISPFGTAEKNRTFVYTCAINGCEFRLPAHKDAKKRIVVDDRVRQFDGMGYTVNLLAKCHVTRKDPNFEIRTQYRCVFCNLIGYQSPLFTDEHELLSHVLTHGGDTLGQVRLEGGVVVTNSGLVVSKSFDVDFPTIEDGESAQRPSPSLHKSDHSHTVTAVDGLSRRVSVTPDENDVKANPWA